MMNNPLSTEKRLGILKARRRAFDEAAALIENTDLIGLFGEYDDEDEQVLADAQEAVVAYLRRRNAR